MNAESLEALHDADDVEHWECPPGFAWESEIAQVAALKPKLEQAIGHSLVLDKNVQDASHFAELSWHAQPRYVPGIGQAILTYLAIRFSAFGRLVALWGNVPEAPLNAAVCEQLNQLLTNAGYTVIPADDLEERYNGQNRFADQIENWWHRFFDYC